MQEQDTMPIMVAIRCITYNHEPYIRQCLEGFVMQKTNFRFVAIIHDDASTDGTAAIIREYEEKYPDIIKPIYETENQYSKRDGSLCCIMNEAVDATNCKYIALCEGDDYWIDPLKLQKQVDFLEANSEYSMCFTNAEVKCEEGVPKSTIKPYNNIQEREYTGGEIFRHWTVPTASVVYRNYYLEGEYPPRDKRLIVGDTPLFLWLSSKGKLWCINEKTIVYRRNMGGFTMQKCNWKKEAEYFVAVGEIFGYKNESKEILTNYLANIFLKGIFNKQFYDVVKYAKLHRILLNMVLRLPYSIIKSLKYKLIKF